MDHKNFIEGLSILARYCPNVTYLQADYDSIYVTDNTQFKIDRRDFARLMDLGFSLDGCSEDYEDYTYGEDYEGQGWFCFV